MFAIGDIEDTTLAPERECAVLGSARVPRAGFGVAPKRTFPSTGLLLVGQQFSEEVREPETVSPARETRALLNPSEPRKLSIWAFADTFSYCQ